MRWKCLLWPVLYYGLWMINHTESTLLQFCLALVTTKFIDTKSVSREPGGYKSKTAIWDIHNLCAFDVVICKKLLKNFNGLQAEKGERIFWAGCLAFFYSDLLLNQKKNKNFWNITNSGIELVITEKRGISSFYFNVLLISWLGSHMLHYSDRAVAGNSVQSSQQRKAISIDQCPATRNRWRLIIHFRKILQSIRTWWKNALVQGQQKVLIAQTESLSPLCEWNSTLLIFQTDGLCLAKALICSNLLLLFSPLDAHIKTDECCWTHSRPASQKHSSSPKQAKTRTPCKEARGCILMCQCIRKTLHWLRFNQGGGSVHGPRLIRRIWMERAPFERSRQARQDTLKMKAKVCRKRLLTALWRCESGKHLHLNGTQAFLYSEGNTKHQG